MKVKPVSLDIPNTVYILFGMCKIYEYKKATKQLKKLPIEILMKYEKWKDIVVISGLGGLKLIKGFNDESLSGEWEGYRSSRLSMQDSVVYKIENGQFYVKVFRMTDHDYRMS